MTRNNLSNHLSWLLRNIADSPPDGPAFPSARDTLESPPATGPIASQDGRGGTNSRSRPLPGSFTERSLTISTSTSTHAVSHREGRAKDESGVATEVARGGGMARLASTTQSKKPSLMVKQQQAQQLLTPASTTGIGPLQQAYQASFRQDEPATVARARRRSPPSVSRRRKTPSPALARGIPEDLDAYFSDEVDLTGVENIESSSPAEDFGEDVRLWRPDFASRPEPMRKQGKKRKSEEINHGSVPSHAQSDTEEFPDINILLRSNKRRPEPSFQCQMTPSKTAAAASRTAFTRETTAIRTTRRQEASNEGAIRGCLDESFEAVPNTSYPGGSSSHSVSTQRKASRTPPVSHPPPEQSPDTGASSYMKKRSSRCSDVIQDSEDEFEYHTPPTHSALATDLMDVDHTDSVAESPLKSQPSPSIINQPARGSQARDTHLDVSGDDPRNGLRTPDESDIPPKEDSQNSDVEKNKHLVRLFLGNQSVLQTKRRNLDDQLQKNSKDYERSLRERWSADQREKVKKEAEPLRKQRKALDEVMARYTAFKSCNDERETLMAELTRAYVDGFEIPDGEVRMEQLGDIIQTKENDLLKSLLAAGLDDLDFLKDQNDSIAALTSPTPVVLSTQATGKRAPPPLSQESTIIPEYNSQVILQTQVPPRNHGPGSANQAYQPVRAMPLPRVLPFKDSDASTRRVGNTEVSNLAANMAFTEEDLSMFDDDDDGGGGDHAFETLASVEARTNFATAACRKKSPGKVSRRVPDDDFDEFSDGEMLAAADDIEQRRSSSDPASTGGRRRTVLSETSGNATAPPKSRALSKPTSSYQPKAFIQPNLMKHPWSQDVRRALKDRFRMSGFRHNQLEAINASLGGHDAFVLMPTGGGKSLCYQLPAVINTGKTRGITIVISPLLSLMQDQVDHLKALNITAGQLNGGMDTEERNMIMSSFDADVPENWLQLLYVTPEMVIKSQAFNNGLMKLHKKKKLARIVIDEAHCVSQWGHDFRPDYKALGAVRRKFPGVPIMALTATATENVIVDVKHNLGMDKCQVFSQSFNRPNLYYEVRKKEPNLIDCIAELIQSKYRGLTGIVYTLSRKSTESIAKKLRGHGIKAHHYHAAMEPPDKVRVQKEWQQGKIKVVVATIAFGMGIDKPDVRFVIHQQIPKSLEGYYQETGRAGRDGEPSGCYLYFAYGDIATLKKMIKDSDGSAQQKERQLNMLARVVSFGENQHACRRVEILRYFGEKFDQALCNNGCDNCKSGRINGNYEVQDFSQYAVAVLETIQEANALTLTQCVEVLTGKKAKDYGCMQHFGMARGMKPHELQRIIYTLAAEGALDEDHRMNNRVGIAISYYILHHAADDFMSGRRKLELIMHASATVAKPRPPPSTNVSSPVRGTAKRQKARNAIPSAVLEAEDEESDEEPDGPLHPNGYEDDGFVVADDEESDDGFAPAKPHHVLPRRRQQTLHELGPSISRDARMDEASIDEIHLDILPVFVDTAKQKEEEIRNNTGQRRNLFTERQYREMAIRWTTTLDEMRRIPGINTENVDKYGSKFLPLVKRYHTQYQEMMGGPPPTVGKPGRTVSGNHDCIDLISSDDDDPYGMEDDNDDDDEEPMESSRYFAEPASRGEQAEIGQFQARIDRINSMAQAAGNSKGRSATSGGSGSGWRGNRGGSRGRRTSGGRGPRARSSSGPGAGAAGGGIAKRKASGGARRGGTAARGSRARVGARRPGGGAGGSGIGMMPI